LASGTTAADRPAAAPPAQPGGPSKAARACSKGLIDSYQLPRFSLKDYVITASEIIFR